MSTTEAAEVGALPKAESGARAGSVGEPTKGSWVVRIAVLAIVILWLIPTAGVLITSFRPELLVAPGHGETERFEVRDVVT